MTKLNTIWISVILLVLIAGTILIEPVNNYETHSRIIRFRVLGLGNVMLDDSPEFTSPILVEKPFVIELDPGTYYWKLTNGLSRIRRFTIISDVGIEINDKEGIKREIRNVGNTKLDLSFREWPKLGITGGAVLDVRKKMEVDLNNTVVVAKEK